MSAAATYSSPTSTPADNTPTPAPVLNHTPGGGIPPADGADAGNSPGSGQDLGETGYIEYNIIISEAEEVPLALLEILNNAQYPAGSRLINGNDGTFTVLDSNNHVLGIYMLNDEGKWVYIPDGMLSMAALYKFRLWHLSVPVVLGIVILFWLSRKVKVTFIANTSGQIIVQRIKRNGKLTEPRDIRKTGSIVEGWYTDPHFMEGWDFSDKVTRNLTLYAKWIEDAYVESVLSSYYNPQLRISG